MNEYEKKFIKAFNKLCNTHSPWQVWNDFVNAVAVSISNKVDKSNYEQREAAYINIENRYTSEQMNDIASLLSFTTMALEENPQQDFLGHIFEELKLSSGTHGQFFTPYAAAELMTKLALGEKKTIAERIEQNGYITVHEPACGAGVNVIAVRAEVVEAGYDPGKRMFVVAQEIERTVAMMCYIQLSLLNVAGYVVIGDTLENSMKGTILAPKFPKEYDIWTLPATLLNIEWFIRRKISGQRNES